MNELIKISESNGKKAVNAKELYLFLGFDKSQWARWARKNILENNFSIKGTDWEHLDIKSSLTEGLSLVVSIDFAKRLSMMARTEKGEQARQYFIAMETVALQQVKPLSEIEILQRSLNLLIEQQKQVKELESRITNIEQRPQINAPIEHFSIMGYCHNIGKQISLGEAKSFGMKCRKMCNELGLVIGKVSDPRFGSVNTYPLDVLKEIIK